MENKDHLDVTRLNLGSYNADADWEELVTWGTRPIQLMADLLASRIETDEANYFSMVIMQIADDMEGFIYRKIEKKINERKGERP